MTFETNVDQMNAATSFLTDERKQAFDKAIHLAKQEYVKFLVAHPSMDSRDYASFRRAFLCEQLKRAFSSMENVVVRNVHGVFMIFFDSSHLMHIKKLDRNLKGTIPKTVLNGQTEPLQLPLPFIDSEIDSEDMIQLRDFYDIIGGYLVDDLGLITGFYFNDQEGDVLNYQEELILSSNIIEVITNEQETNPQTTITLKKPRKANDSKAVEENEQAI